MKYLSEDGKVFMYEEECLAHEKSVRENEQKKAETDHGSRQRHHAGGEGDIAPHDADAAEDEHGENELTAGGSELVHRYSTLFGKLCILYQYPVSSARKNCECTRETKA